MAVWSARRSPGGASAGEAHARFDTRRPASSAGGPPHRTGRGSWWGFHSDRGRGEAPSSGEGKHSERAARRAKRQVGDPVALGAPAELVELPADRVLERLLVRPRLPAELLARLV